VAKIAVSVDATGAKAGADQVNTALKSMADQAAASVSAIDRIKGALQSAGSTLGVFGSTVERSVGKSTSSFSSLSGVVGVATRALAGFGAVAAAGALFKFTKDAIDTTSALVDTADKLGVTVEALQELRFAARQTGATNEQLDKGLEQLSIRLAQAAAGTGKAKDVIKALGLDARELAKDPVKAVSILAEKLAGVANQADRLKDIKALGLGPALTNLLQQGGPALDALKQKARDLGLVISDELARKTESLGDKFDTLTDIIGTQFKTALLDLAPVLIKFAGLIADAARETVRLGQVAGVLSKSTTQEIKETSQKIFDAQQKIARLQDEKAAGGGNPVSKFFGTSDRDIAFATGQVTEYQKKLGELQAEFVKITPVIKTTNGEIEGTTKANDAAIKSTEALIKRTKENAATMNLTGAALADQIVKQALANGATQEQGERLRAAVIAEEAAKKAKEDHTKAIQDQAEAQRKAAALEKAIEADRVKRENFLSDLITKRNVEDQQKAEANAKSVLGLKNETVALQEEGQLLQASLGPKKQLQAVELAIAKARIERQIATERVTLEEDGLTQAEAEGLAQKRDVLLANAEKAASFAAMGNAIEDAALTTGDLKTITQGILSGTQDISSVFEDLGQTLGSRLVEGILFGKGQDEQAIIGNFNSLLGVDAAGLFGAQGSQLGTTLIGSILGSVQSGANSLLSSVGIDLGGIFGGSFNTAAAGSVGSGLFDNVIAGSSSTAAAGGGALGTIFGAAMAGAAGLSLGKGLGGLFGVGGTKTGKIGGTVGGVGGAIGGGLIGSLFGPKGTIIGAGIGGAIGSFFGGFIGDLFTSKPSKGTEIRKGVKTFLKDIEVSFAKEIDEGNYFFEETKKLAKKMFGGEGGKDFLKASKMILDDKIGPELAKQLQALGTFITADQAKKLGKPVEQTGTTFGNLLLDNLGLDPEEIDGAIQEIIQKANISFEALTKKLTDLFEKDKISVDFYKNTIAGAVEIFNHDLPDAINVAGIALKSFGEDGLFDLKKFQTELTKVSSVFDVVVGSFVDVVTNAKPGEDVGALLAKQINDGLQKAAADAFLADFIANKLFEGIDLSDGLGEDELAKIVAGAGEARTAVEALWDAFGDPTNEIDKTGEKVDDLFDKLRDLTQQRYDLRLNVLGDLESIGSVSGVDAARQRISAGGATLQGLGGSRTTPFSDAELSQGLDAVRNLRSAQVEFFQAQESAEQDALQKRIQSINEDFAARQAALQRETKAAQEAAQDAAEARQAQLADEKDGVEKLFRARLDGLQKELQVAENFKQVAESLQQTINGLVQSSSPFSRPEQLGLFQRQANDLRGKIAGAPREEQAGLIQQLSENLSTQLSTGKEFLDPTRFANLFNSVVGELEQLRTKATEEGNRAELLQQEIAATTAQMEVNLRAIDESIKQAQVDGRAAELQAQVQADELSRLEREAVSQAEQATAVELGVLRDQTAQEIRNLALIEDAILAAQQARVQEQIDLTQEQVNLLGSINQGIMSLENSLITAFSGVISAARGYDGTLSRPQMFLAHGGEHVSITPAGQENGQSVSVTVPVSVAFNSTGENPQAIEEAVIQAIADDIRGGGKIRRAIKEVR